MQHAAISTEIELPIVDVVCQGLRKSGQVIHAICGPRQVGKTTAAQQIIKKLGWGYHLASADGIRPENGTWIEAQWNVALSQNASEEPVLLVLDEIQKIQGWSEILKRLWDENQRILGPKKKEIRVLCLGSSALLLQEGLTESLAGRFFLHRLMHWTWNQMQKVSSCTLDQWIYYGGYPGSVSFLSAEGAWKQYIRDSLIEAALARDVLSLQKVAKPALLRNLFATAVEHPAQIVSYTKMLGQLVDAGNTTTLARYLQLLDTAFLVTGMTSYSGSGVRQRASSPKIVVRNSALISALSVRSFERARSDHIWWGRMVENAVGLHLLNSLGDLPVTISYWRDGDDEVDYVIHSGEALWAIEVKSGRARSTSGLTKFKQRYPHARPLIIGATGLSLEDFFNRDVRDIFG